jgi:hypothetical protein
MLDGPSACNEGEEAAKEDVQRASFISGGDKVDCCRGASTASLESFVAYYNDSKEEAAGEIGRHCQEMAVSTERLTTLSLQSAFLFPGKNQKGLVHLIRSMYDVSRRLRPRWLGAAFCAHGFPFTSRLIIGLSLASLIIRAHRSLHIMHHRPK